MNAATAVETPFGVTFKALRIRAKGEDVTLFAVAAGEFLFHERQKFHTNRQFHRYVYPHYSEWWIFRDAYKYKDELLEYEAKFGKFGSLRDLKSHFKHKRRCPKDGILTTRRTGGSTEPKGPPIPHVDKQKKPWFACPDCGREIHPSELPDR